MPVYSEKVMDHFMHPRNVGEIENADGVGEVGNPVCGDMMTFYIKVKDGKLADVKFKTFGCGAAIAVSSMVSEMAMGKTLEEAQKITPEMVAKELEGLPKQKFHCSNLGAQALNKAIDDYLIKQGMLKRDDSKCCPFCDHEEEEGENSICSPCQVKNKPEEKT
jgi:nitrogen fixation protein NifU and related proteins